MIQSGRIRDVGLQFENKLVGKPLYLHGFILGLFYGGLNSGDITSMLCALQQWSAFCIVYAVCFASVAPDRIVMYDC